MKAIVLQGDKKASLVTDRPLPQLRRGYVLVKTKAVALNPTDWKHREYGVLNVPDHLSGCDYAGVIEELGPDLQKSWKVGDRICGFVHGGNSLQKEDGAFAEKIVVKAGAQLKLPESYSFEEGSTFGVAVMTCGQGLYQQMGLNWPNEPTKDKENILIYGGSSAMGTMGVQLAKLSGYNVIATCSPRNFDLVKSMGASEVFDYKDPESIEKIKKLNVKLAWDTISLESSAEFCAKVLAKDGAYGKILDVPMQDRPDVKQTYSLGYTSLGERVEKPFGSYTQEVCERDYGFMQKWMAEGDRLVAEKKLKPHPIKVSQGFEGIIQGMDDMRDDKVSGQKLVFTV